MQLGKKTSGDMIDPEPERKEGFATATFDLEAIRWQRARYDFHSFVYRRQLVNLTFPCWSVCRRESEHCISVALCIL